MPDITETKKLLDEVNAAIASYDPVLKEQARDILLRQAFGTEFKTATQGGSAKTNSGGSQTSDAVRFHELVEKWSPTTQADWALLGAYYCQVVLAHESVTALEVNKVLKQHGTVVANITNCFEENIGQNPALMRQIGKSGKSKQAKKKYVVTTNGVQFIEAKLNGKA